MLRKGATEIVSEVSPGYYSSMFVAPKTTGGWRPIINLSVLNKSITKLRFKM